MNENETTETTPAAELEASALNNLVMHVGLIEPSFLKRWLGNLKEGDAVSMWQWPNRRTTEIVESVDENGVRFACVSYASYSLEDGIINGRGRGNGWQSSFIQPTIDDQPDA
jgi:hypothetical protein